MMMKNLSMIGRVLYALPFIVFGAFHLMQAPNMASFVPTMFPGSGTFWVYLTGVIFIGGGLGILLKKYTYYAALLIALQLLVFGLTIWVPELGGV